MWGQGDGTGVFGQANKGDKAVGVRGESLSGIGVIGIGGRIGGSFVASGANGIGVASTSNSLNG